METFDFPFHTVSDEYPVSSTTIKLGGGYQFASKPRGPDQILFKLSFKAMWFGTLNAQIDMQAMIDFYEAHRLYEPFEYEHPTRGLVVVRFSKPLVVPKGIEGGGGQTEPVSIELILQP